MEEVATLQLYAEQGREGGRKVGRKKIHRETLTKGKTEKHSKIEGKNRSRDTGKNGQKDKNKSSRCALRQLTAHTPTGT